MSALRLVLLGKTGSGKSSTGNTLMDRDVFISSVSASSVTADCAVAEGSGATGREVTVVDTPGLFDTRNDDDDKDHVDIGKRCLDLSGGHVDAFLLVVRVGRFTEEEGSVVEDVARMFGEDVYSHLVVIFAGGDDLEHHGKTVQDFCSSSDAADALRSLVNRVDGRALAWNNRGSQQERKEGVEELLNVVDRMVLDNAGTPYTTEAFQKAQQVAEERKEVQGLHPEAAAIKAEQEALNRELLRQQQQQLEQQQLELQQQQQEELQRRQREEEDQRIEVRIKQELDRIGDSIASAFSFSF